MRFDLFIKKLHNKKCVLAVLVDPDKFSPELIKLSEKNNVDVFLVGGSKLKRNNLTLVIKKIKRISSLPVVIFPGDEKQISKSADGLLLLSLLSGRNPDYLIGKHVKAAEEIKRSKLKTLPTAYLLIDGGNISTTQKITQTTAISPSKPLLIKNTSIAGEQLGFKAIYLEAGSGARNNIPASIVRLVKRNVTVPVIAGGGIDSAKKAKELVKAGANMIVVGNALETKKELIEEIGKVFK